MSDRNSPADRDMLTRWEMGPANTSVPILRRATGIPSVPSAEVLFSPAMTLEIRPALAKPKEKEFFPPVSPSLGIAVTFGVLF
jgi:hypothetical protein